MLPHISLAFENILVVPDEKLSVVLVLLAVGQPAKRLSLVRIIILAVLKILLLW